MIGVGATLLRDWRFEAMALPPQMRTPVPPKRDVRPELQARSQARSQQEAAGLARGLSAGAAAPAADSLVNQDFHPRHRGLVP